MPGQHATLSPSSAERWISCPASVRVSQGIPKGPDSPYAAEGTAAHALGEIKAAAAFGKITTRQFAAQRAIWAADFSTFAEDPEGMADMEVHTDSYVDLIRERMSHRHHSQLMLEQKMDAGLPECWGTSDAVIVSPTHVEIIDLKYGQGVAVEARGNPQLRLYALGALDTYGDILGETDLVTMTVFQPRLGHTLSDDMTPEALRHWRQRILPLAEEALGPDAHFGPSEDACRWCPVSGRCRAQLEAVFAEPFELPDLLTPEVVSATLARVPEIREWLKAFEEAALNMAYSEGTAIPDYKVVLSGGQRKVQNEVEAIQTLVAGGYTVDEVTVTKIRGIGELEKLLGKPRFAELLEDSGIVQKSEGRPSLVPESDKRPAVAPNTEAAKVFGEDPA